VDRGNNSCPLCRAPVENEDETQETNVVRDWDEVMEMWEEVVRNTVYSQFEAARRDSQGIVPRSFTITVTLSFDPPG
jgi:hypothetical protein